MTKSAEAFRTISEVADWLNTPTHVLRFWESKFSQIKPVKRAGGRRYYRPQDMLLIGGIKKLLHSDGLTIKAVKKILLEQGQKYVCNLSKPVDAPRTTAETGVDKTASVEGDLVVNKADWKPIGLTKLATDLGEDGKIMEPNAAERGLPDLAIEQIDALGKLAAEESLASEAMNITKASEPSDAPIGALGEGLSDTNKKMNSDLNSQPSEITNASSGRSKRVSIKETKKSSDMFDDDQPMLNFWTSDYETSDNESIKDPGKTADQESALPADADLTTFNEMSNSAKSVHLSNKPEPDNSIIDQAEHQEMDQDLVRENVAFKASSHDEISGAPAAGRAVSAHIDALVIVDNVAENAKLLEAETAQTPVHATLRSIGDHLDRQPIVSPVQAKALRTGLTALENAIAKRSVPALKE